MKNQQRIPRLSLQKKNNLPMKKLNPIKSNVIVVLLLCMFSILSVKAQTTIDLASTGDNYMIDLSPDAQYGNVDNFLQTGTGVVEGVTLFQFDVSSIPVGATITNATLDLSAWMTAGGNQTDNIYRMTTAWTEGDGSTGSGSTWNDSDGNGPGDWTSGTFSASDYNSTVLASISATTTVVRYSKDVTSTVVNWVDGTNSNYGFGVVTASGVDNEYTRYRPREYATAADRPVLSVTYTSTCNTVYDQFNSQAYNLNDGTINWETNWEDYGETTSATTGNVIVDPANLFLKMNVAGYGAYREADLSSATSAVLTFDIESVDNGNDYYISEISYDGGANYTQLEEFQPVGSTGNETLRQASKSYTLESASLSADVIVRFRVTAGYSTANGQYAAVDNVKIDYCANAMILTTSVTGESCTGVSNGAIDLTVSGNVGNTTFSWTGPNGFTASTEDINGLSAGTYNVTVTDTNGNESTSATVIIDYTNMSLSTAVTQLSAAAATDGAIDLTVSDGGGVYSYNWTKNGSAYATTEDLTGLGSGT